MPNVFLDAIKPVAPTVTTHEGGDAYAADKWSRLRRFLIIGTEGGTFYASQRDLTLDNISVLQDCLNEDALKTVGMIGKISHEGLAIKNDPAIFALSVVVSRPEVEIRKMGYFMLPTVIRTGTHLLHFMAYCKAQRKSSAGLRRAIGRWFTDKSADQLAYQAIKYQQRDGWSLADVLKLARPTAENEAQNAVLKWIVSGEVNEYAPQIIRSREYINAPDIVLPSTVTNVIREHRLPREAVPTQYLNDPDVWDALLQDMLITATIRNLAKMTSVGLLQDRNDAVKLVIDRITDEERLQKGRVHPISLLNALRVYEQGHGDKGKLTWKPVKAIVNALDEAFYLAFKAVEPTNKRICLALDVSLSMTWPTSQVPGMALTARDVAAAMALVTAAKEPHAQIMAYSGQIVPLDIRPSMRLDDVIRVIKSLQADHTICSLPFAWADQNGLTFDAFVSYTDSETADHYYQRNLATYRRSRNKHARAAVVAMASNQFTLADPFDPRQLDVAGFSADTPAVLSDFIAGRL